MNPHLPSESEPHAADASGGLSLPSPEHPLSYPSDIPLSDTQRAGVEKLLAEQAESARSRAEWRQQDDKDTAEFLAEKELNMKWLSPESDLHGSSRIDENEIDRLIQIALSLSPHGEHDDLISAGCAAFTRCSSYNHASWAHAVCHNFERFGSSNQHGSLFDRPDLRGPAEALLREAAHRATRFGGASFDRTMGGVIRFALSLVSTNQLDEPFPWKPEFLRDPRLADAVGRSSIEALFCLAHTPRQFIEQVATLIAGSKEPIYGPRIPLDLLAAARNERNAGDIDRAIVKQLGLDRRESCSVGHTNDLDLSAAQVKDLLASRASARGASEVTPGLFVDVGQTLIELDRRTLEPRLTQTAELIALFAPGSRVQVTIFTGGDPQTATERLAALGFPGELLPVTGKKEFREQRLACLIDDTSPDGQGFAAERWIRPGDRSGWLKSDPLGAVARFRQQGHPQPDAH